MTCQLCNSEIEIENINSTKKADDLTDADYVHSIASFNVCLGCKEKILQFFRDLVNT